MPKRKREASSGSEGDGSTDGEASNDTHLEDKDSDSDSDSDWEEETKRRSRAKSKTTPKAKNVRKISSSEDEDSSASDTDDDQKRRSRAKKVTKPKAKSGAGRKESSSEDENSSASDTDDDDQSSSDAEPDDSDLMNRIKLKNRPATRDDRVNPDLEPSTSQVAPPTPNFDFPDAPEIFKIICENANPCTKYETECTFSEHKLHAILADIARGTAPGSFDRKYAYNTEWHRRERWWPDKVDLSKHATGGVTVPDIRVVLTELQDRVLEVLSTREMCQVLMQVLKTTGPTGFDCISRWNAGFAEFKLANPDVLLMFRRNRPKEAANMTDHEIYVQVWQKLPGVEKRAYCGYREAMMALFKMGKRLPNGLESRWKEKREKEITRKEEAKQRRREQQRKTEIARKEEKRRKKEQQRKAEERRKEQLKKLELKKIQTCQVLKKKEEVEDKKRFDRFEEGRLKRARLIVNATDD